MARAAWNAYPWLTLSGGYEDRWLYENDRARSSGLDTLGGGLFGVTPGLRVSGRLGERVRLDLSGQVAYERFGNVIGRDVLGAAAEADLRVRVGRSWLWRSSLAGNRYADSAYETGDRIGGGFETGFGVARVGWALEVLGGVEGRRYENLVTADDTGLPGRTPRPACSLGCRARPGLASGDLFSVRVIGQTTDARDPLYDADSWLAQGSRGRSSRPSCS